DYTNGEKLLKEIIEENSINQNTKNKESRKLDKEDFIDEILTSTETLADKQTKNAIETQSN
ncbi:18811_t:CDS:1, partial [Gigaspora rosea]